MSTYVIVRPGDRGHVSDNPEAHLVVEVTEWVAVDRQDKPGYDFVIEHHSFDAAHNERNRLNGVGDRVFTDPQPEATVEPKEVKPQWLGEKV